MVPTKQFQYEQNKAQVTNALLQHLAFIKILTDSSGSQQLRTPSLQGFTVG